VKFVIGEFYINLKNCKIWRKLRNR